MGFYFFLKNFVCLCVTLHKGVIIWLGKDTDEIEEYVVTEPYSPARASRMGQFQLVAYFIIILLFI